MLAVVPVRRGQLPLGADEAVAEAGGDVVLIGDGTDQAAGTLAGPARARCVEVGSYRPAAWSIALAPLLTNVGVVVLPASADGRDLAPRLAHVLDRRLLAGAIMVSPTRVILARRGGLIAETHEIDERIVATLEPGSRGVSAGGIVVQETLEVDVGDPNRVSDAEVLDVLPPDPATIDLAEASRIVAGGAGLGGPEPFEALRAVARGLGAAWGASRVAADVGWVPQDRFIGTTGVTISARLYVAFGISGAVQHVTGLGAPDHIVAVNLDPSAPMMGMADLAIVTDARQLLRELADRLGPTQDG